MKAEPPVGDELTELLTAVKGRVLRSAPQRRQQRRRSAVAGLIVAGAALLAVGGAGTAVAVNLAGGVFHPIPHSSHRASDPPQPTFKPGADNRITPEQASLDQLWALAKSEVDDSGSGPGTPGVGVGMADFAAAITARCYPQLDASQTAELDSLKTAFQSASPDAALAPARAYFSRATELCM